MGLLPRLSLQPRQQQPWRLSCNSVLPAMIMPSASRKYFSNPKVKESAVVWKMTEEVQSVLECYRCGEKQ